MATHRIRYGEHYRGFTVYKKGDPIDPFPEELRSFPDRFEAIPAGPAEFDEPPDSGGEAGESQEAAAASKGDPEVEKTSGDSATPEGGGEEEGETPEETFPKALPGGWYVLSNGERIQGKAKAEEAQRAILEAAGGS